MRRLAIVAAAVGLALLAGVATAGMETAAWEWEGVPRIVAVGDVHGSYDKLVRLLRGTGLLDEDDRWSGARDHLVMVGDFVDRQPGDRPIMDLLMRLQGEAEAAGGRVHVLLGNHEVLNLLRDLRYVAPAAYADFAKEESKKERKAARRYYRGGRSKFASDFDARYPPGFFARLRAFGEEGRYGLWLLECPTVVKVNGTIFVHGGLTERVAELGIAGINSRVRRELLEQIETRQWLEERRIVNPLMGYTEAAEAAYAYMLRSRGGGGAHPRLVAAVAMFSRTDSLILGSDGPLWYRGSSVEDERLERGRLTQVLELLGAEQMVVAHSPTTSQNIMSRFAGRLFRVDHGMYLGNNPLALTFQNGQVLVFETNGGELAHPRPADPRGEREIDGADRLVDAEIERLLSTAKIVDARDLGRGSTRPQLFEMEDGNRRLRGIFKTVEEHAERHPERRWDRYQHEVAAYRLDRMLGLDLVPVTVVRKNGRQRGSLQQWVEGAVDQVSLDSCGLELADPERLRRQSEQGRLFDLLIGNVPRKPTDVLYLLGESRLVYIDHSRAFPVARELGGEREGMPPSLDPRLRAALEALDEEGLTGELGELLSRRQIEAILSRRDAILREYAAREGPESADAATSRS